MNPTAATYRIRLVERGSGALVPGCEFLTGGLDFEFTRILNDPSEMALVLNLADEGCDFTCDCVPEARRHELVAFRSDRPTEAAWVGPVLNILEEPAADTITINAKDRLWWLTGAQASRNIGPTDFGAVDVNGEVSVVVVVDVLLRDALRYNNPGIILPATLPPDLSGVRVDPPVVEAGESIWFYLRSYLGTLVDMTMVGQNLYWGSPEVPVVDGIDLSTRANWKDAQQPSTDVDGQQAASQVVVRGAPGIRAVYPPTDEDLGYGRFTLFISDTEITTQDEAQSRAQFVWERNNEPALFVISGDGSLNDATDVAVADLIPGRKHRIRGDQGCIRTDDRRRITAVVVSGSSTQDRGRYVVREDRVALDFQPPGTEGDPTQVTA